MTLRLLGRPFLASLRPVIAGPVVLQQQVQGQHFSASSSGNSSGNSRAGTWAAAAAGSAAICFGAWSWAASAEADKNSLKVQLPSGSQVEVLTPSSGDWEVKLQPAKPKGVMPETITLPGRFSVPPPPYPLDALEPYMSRSTLEYHWGKHHRTYAENLNKQLAAEGFDSDGLGGSLEEVVKASWNKGKPLPIFNNAAQVWNHTFFWDGMKPGGGGAPAPGTPLAEAIERDFGGLGNLKKELQAVGLAQFGSGWAWLVCDHEGTLKVFKTSNAVPPIVSGWRCLLTIDVWEHAYYLDHQNRRADYITIFLEHLVSWDKVAQRYEQATA